MPCRTARPDRNPPASSWRGPAAGAFTLVELLVVIAILALLVAILMPALSRARALAQLVACQANLRSQAAAHRVYGEENGDAKPPLLRVKPSGSLEYDFVSPDVKWAMGTRVGQGLLVQWHHVEFGSLLCPAAALQRDSELDTALWLDETALRSGCSYVYYWRDTTGLTAIGDLLTSPATYSAEEQAGRRALAMDINCDEGHGSFVGDYADRTWRSHPVLGRINVSYLDCSVGSSPSADLSLAYPGDGSAELAWFAKAHRLH